MPVLLMAAAAHAASRMDVSQLCNQLTSLVERPHPDRHLHFVVRRHLRPVRRSRPRPPASKQQPLNHDYVEIDNRNVELDHSYIRPETSDAQ